MSSRTDLTVDDRIRLCGVSRRSVSEKISQYTIDKDPFKGS
jgi:hypothetical protein